MSGNMQFYILLLSVMLCEIYGRRINYKGNRNKVYYVAAKSCSISIDDFQLEPVYLTSVDGGKSYAPFKPEGKVTEIEDGTQLLLLCAGKSNKFKTSGADTMDLTCKNGAFKDNKNKIHAVKDLQCTAIPTADLQVTEERCALGLGVIYEAGFKYNGDKFAALFSVCYDQPTQTVYYTHNVINGKAISHSISESTRRAFRADGMGKTTTSVNKLYTTAHQISHFNKVYGKDQTYVTKQNFIARGHLTPDADGITRWEQLATYFYCNALPEFQNINAGNWLRVETLARKAAGILNTDLDTYNGAFGNVEWADASGNLVKAYLDDEQLFAVPKYFFKAIVNKKENSGIVMVTINDPHIQNPEAAVLCKDVCAEANMIHADFPRVERGFTTCCTVSEFLKHYKYLPKDVSAKTLLTI